MPCDDLSEVVTVVLDGEERLRYFLYEKLTCGKIVPLSGRLNDLCRGMTIGAIERLTVEGAAGALGLHDDESLYLVDKELDALQSALANYRGSEPGPDPDRYKVESIDYAPDGVTIRQVIVAPKPERRIPSCRTLHGPEASPVRLDGPSSRAAGPPRERGGVG